MILFLLIMKMLWHSLSTNIHVCAVNVFNSVYRTLYVLYTGMHNTGAECTYSKGALQYMNDVVMLTTYTRL